jgi:hypothetical protein
LWGELEEGMVIHYDEDYLMVFGSVEDHLKYHRGEEVEPLWVGEYIK